MVMLVSSESMSAADGTNTLKSTSVGSMIDDSHEKGQ